MIYKILVLLIASILVVVRFMNFDFHGDFTPVGFYKTLSHCFVFFLFGYGIGTKNKFALFVASYLTLVEIIAFTISFKGF